MKSVRPGVMFFVLDTNGKYWDGFGWSQQGREFLTVAQATRSLYEEGEGTESVIIITKGTNDPT